MTMSPCARRKTKTICVYSKRVKYTENCLEYIPNF